MLKDRELHKQRCKAYYRQHREALLSKAKGFYWEDVELSRLAQKVWRSLNHDRYRAYSRKYYKKAKSLKIAADLETSEKDI